MVPLARSLIGPAGLIKEIMACLHPQADATLWLVTLLRNQHRSSCVRGSNLGEEQLSVRSSAVREAMLDRDFAGGSC